MLLLDSRQPSVASDEIALSFGLAGRILHMLPKRGLTTLLKIEPKR